MPVYRIKKYPDPSLREKCSRVENVGVKERKILARMAETMYSAGGIGLAGPQVGINQQFIVVDVGEGLIKLVNPKMRREDKALCRRFICPCTAARDRPSAGHSYN